MPSLKDLSCIIDEHIRRGRGGEARRELQKLEGKRVPRELASTFAALARRAHLSEVGLRLLNPIVRLQRKSPLVASDQEKAEYAACLERIGAIDEALGLLRELDGEKHPEVWLFQAAAFIGQWGYEEAIPLLRRYIVSPRISDYQRLVGKVNLAASLIYEREHLEATPLLEELIGTTGGEQLTFLRGISRHLVAMNFIFQAKWSEAWAALDQARKALSQTDSLEEFLVRKWEAILDLLEKGPRPRSLEVLHGIRKEAMKLRHWETLRDCDRFEAIAKADVSLVIRLYFGSPMPGFRKWLLLSFGRPILLPDHYAWSVCSEKDCGPILDMTGDIVPEKGKRLAIGELRYRLLSNLCSDFYRPFRLGSLHSGLYPGEYFRPSTSPLRVHQAIARLRSWFRDCGFPLQVKEVDGFFCLASEAPFVIRLPSEVVARSRENPMDRLGKSWANRLFSAGEAAAALHVSHRTALRLLEAAQESGFVTKVGTGTATRYCFSEDKSVAKPTVR